MKRLFNLLFLLFPIVALSQMRQVHLEVQTENDVKNLSFYSNASGYVAFDKWIGFTNDSGRTFEKKYITLSNVDFNNYDVNVTFGFFIRGIKALSQSNIIAYGNYALQPSILFSSNGGTSYSLVYKSESSISANVSEMLFPSNNGIGYALDGDKLLKTSDYGINWSVIYFNSNRWLRTLKADNIGNIFVIAEGQTSDRLLKSTNQGITWNDVILPQLDNKRITGYYFSNTNGWVSMYNVYPNGYLYKTNNSGSSWSLLNDPNFSPINIGSMLFINDSTGFSIGGNYKVLKTSDEGRHWEPLPRDNNFTYYSFSHSDMQFHGNTQFWAGGAHGFIELNTNPSGKTLPIANFSIDTIGLSSSKIVKLINYSKADYQFRWYVNEHLVSTNFNSSYEHNPQKNADTIKLIVSNELSSDTLTKIQYFIAIPPPPISTITKFSPDTGYTGSLITIEGTNLDRTTNVIFGSTPAVSYNIVNANKIVAEVGSGGTGSIVVNTTLNSVTAPGFTYITRLKVESFSPASASTNTVLSISGTGFHANPAENLVYFGTTKATVISSSYYELHVLVPPNAGNEHISVSVDGKTVTSPTSFQFITLGNCALNSASFLFEKDYGVDYYPELVKTGDLDNDGKIDVVVNCTWKAVINIFKNTSTRENTSLNRVADIVLDSLRLIEYNTYSIVDMNKDEKLDIVALYGGEIFIYFNNSTPGSISFMPAKKINNPTGIYMKDIRWIDFDGDGLPELTGLDEGGILIYKNTSIGDSISFQSKPAVAADPDYHMIAYEAEDFDGDKKIDIVVSKRAFRSSAISFFKNTCMNGDINFTLSKTFNTDSTSGWGAYLKAGDYNNDGKKDIAFFMFLPGTLKIYKNTSSNFDLKLDQIMPLTISEEFEEFLTQYDANGDGKLDLLLAHWEPSLSNLANGNTFSVFQNQSSSQTVQFKAEENFGLLERPHTRSIAIADINMDGKPDVVATHSNPFSTPSITVYKNNVCNGQPVIACIGSSTQFKSNLIGANYQWQVDTGSGYANIANSSLYAGSNSATLSITNVAETMYGYSYRCMVDGSLSTDFKIQLKNTWTGSNSNYWSDPMNWSCNRVPDQNTDVIISAGTVILNSNSSCKTLLIAPDVNFQVNTGYSLTIFH